LFFISKGGISVIVEFILGTLVEAGIKMEEALQARGLGYLVPLILLLVILLCLGGCCALLMLPILFDFLSRMALSIH